MIYDHVWNLKVLMHVLLADGGLSLGLSDQILQIVLKTFRIFQEMHSDVVVCVTLTQTRQQRAGT